MLKQKIKYVYCAGAITSNGEHSSNTAIDYLINMKKMVRSSVDLLFAGFTPFCPVLDFMYFLQLKDGEHITEQTVKRASKDWLKKCDCIMLTPGWKRSPGTIKEIEYAEKLGIRVFKTLKELIQANKED